MTTASKHKRSRRIPSANNHMQEIRRRAVHIGEDVRAMAATAGSAAGDSLGPVEDYVRKQPIKSLLMAAAAGAVLGVVFLRR